MAAQIPSIIFRHVVCVCGKDYECLVGATVVVAELTTTYLDDTWRVTRDAEVWPRGQSHTPPPTPGAILCLANKCAKSGQFFQLFDLFNE